MTTATQIPEKQSVEKEIQRFFDFYSINELYLRTGGFRNTGYVRFDTFVPSKIEERIAEMYEEIVSKFFEEIKKALSQSLKSEMRYYKVNEEDSKDYFKKYGITIATLGKARQNPLKYPYVVYLAFCEPRQWENGYGGKKWSKGAKLLMELSDVKTTQDKVYWVDRVLDLYHHGGHMINKTTYSVLSDDVLCYWVYENGKKKRRQGIALNIRARSKSIINFLPFNSERVRQLVIPRINLLTTK